MLRSLSSKLLKNISDSVVFLYPPSYDTSMLRRSLFFSERSRQLCNAPEGVQHDIGYGTQQTEFGLTSRLNSG